MISAEASFQVTEAELLAATRRNLPYSTKVQIQVATSLLVIVAGVVLMQSNSSQGWLLVALGACLLGWDYVGPILRARRNFRASPFRENTANFDFSEDRIEFKSETSSSSFPWTAVTRVRELGDLYVLLMNGGRTMLVIPRRAFSDANEDRFRELSAKGTKVSWR